MNAGLVWYYNETQPPGPELHSMSYNFFKCSHLHPWKLTKSLNVHSLGFNINNILIEATALYILKHWIIKVEPSYRACDGDHNKNKDGHIFY